MIKKAILGLSVLCCTFLLCGFDSSESADSVMSKSSNAADSATSYAADLTFVCDLDIVLGSSSVTTTINLDIDADYDIEVILDPLAMMVDGSYTFKGLLDGDPEKTTIYTVTNDDGSLGIYTFEEDALSENEGDGTWTYAEDSSVDYNTLISQISSMDLGTLDGGDVNFTLSSEPADYNGIECYLLSAQIDAAELEQIIADAGYPSDQELYEGFTLGDLLSALEGLKLNIDYYVDDDSYLPAGIHMDLNASDLSSLNNALQSLIEEFDDDEESSIEVDLNDISLDLPLSFNSVDSISVPQEALDAAASAGTGEAQTDLSEDLYEQQSSASA